MRFFGPSKVGNALIVVGLLLLLYVPVSYGLTDVQGMLLRARLRAEHPTSAIVATDDWPEAKDSPVVATSTPGAQRSGPETLAGSGHGGTPDGRPAEATPMPDSQSLADTGTYPPVVPTSHAPLPTKTPLPPSPAPTPTPAHTPTSTAVPILDGPPVRVAIPDLQIDTAVTRMGWTMVMQSDGTTQAEWKVPDDTAGWAVTSAELGVPGNIVLSGHNNIYAMVFRSISLAWPENAKQQLNPATYSSDILNGRLIQLYAADGKRFEYEITGFYRLHDSGVPLQQRQENASYMQPTEVPVLTLITCWPPWSNTYRVVLRARLVQ